MVREFIYKEGPNEEDILRESIVAAETEVRRLEELIVREYDALDIEDQKESLVLAKKELGRLTNTRDEQLGVRMPDSEAGQGSLER